MKKEEQKRIVIYPKDVSNITGFKPQSARKLLRNMREALGKPPRAFITITEFCEIYGVTEEEIRPFLDLS